MYHRKPEKYKEFEGMDNIIVGKGELIRIDNRHGVGWRAPCGAIIKERDKAIAYAIRLNDRIQKNLIRLGRAKSKYK